VAPTRGGGPPEIYTPCHEFEHSRLAPSIHTVILFSSSTMVMGLHFDQLRKARPGCQDARGTMSLRVYLPGSSKFTSNGQPKEAEHLVAGGLILRTIPHALHGANAKPAELFFSLYFAMTGFTPPSHSSWFEGIWCLGALAMLCRRTNRSSRRITCAARELIDRYWTSSTSSGSHLPALLFIRSRP